MLVCGFREHVCRQLVPNGLKSPRIDARRLPSTHVSIFCRESFNAGLFFERIVRFVMTSFGQNSVTLRVAMNEDVSKVL
jgi:hypothetical protein